jgi:hypothetical protein
VSSRRLSTNEISEAVGAVEAVANSNGSRKSDLGVGYWESHFRDLLAPHTKYREDGR